MTKLIDLIKIKLKKNPAYPIIAGAILLFETAEKVTDFLHKIVFTHLSISVLIILVIVFLTNVFNDILSHRDLYSQRLIKILKVGRYLIYIFLLLPTFWVFTFFKSKQSEEELCNETFKKTGLLIASFNGKHAIKEGFTSNLYGRLNSDIQNIDTINLRRLRKFIDEDNSHYLDTIKSTFEENCSRTGLIVFGDSESENSFNCRIYSYNFLNFSTKGFSRTKDNAIIYIQNPDVIKTPHLINFTIDNEATVVADFIIGLLYNNAGNYTASTNAINKALSENNNHLNKQFIAYCHLFIGNNSFKQKNNSDAIAQYKAGIAADSIIDHLHYNLAVVDRQERKITEANFEYKIAQNLNRKFKSPLREIKVLAKNDVSKILNAKENKKAVKRTSTKSDTAKKIIIPVNWEEHCYTIKIKEKYGVINNVGDTIVSCRYDYIESYPYKNADCFILFLNKKYGAVIHVHTSDGYYTKQQIPIEYSQRTIYEAITNCVDSHY
ncbi:MAG TPA: hypothetical protein VK668_19465 [Mucilaginibacter sp.]|nr:hypothetical protein [Mucilaginibacter sp.]